MSRENLVVTVVPVATPFAALAGVVETTVGGAVLAVVNAQTYGEPIALPVALVIEPSRRAVYLVVATSEAFGWRIAVCVVLS